MLVFGSDDLSHGRSCKLSPLNNSEVKHNFGFALDACKKSSKNIIPNGGLIVIYHCKNWKVMGVVPRDVLIFQALEFFFLKKTSAIFIQF